MIRLFHSTVLNMLEESKIYLLKDSKKTLLSLQACFVIAHSSGDSNDKNIHNRRSYTIIFTYICVCVRACVRVVVFLFWFKNFKPVQFLFPLSQIGYCNLRQKIIKSKLV